MPSFVPALQLNVEAEYAIKMLEEDPVRLLHLSANGCGGRSLFFVQHTLQMKDIISRADAIGLKTDNIEKLRTLIFNTPEEKFVQLQLKAAVALNDPARVTRVTIRLKDLFFKKAGPMFALDNYPRYRSRMAWAK